MNNGEKYILAALILMLSGNFVVAVGGVPEEYQEEKQISTPEQQESLLKRFVNGVLAAHQRGIEEINSQAAQDNQKGEDAAAAKKVDKPFTTKEISPAPGHLVGSTVINGQLKDQDGFPMGNPAPPAEILAPVAPSDFQPVEKSRGGQSWGLKQAFNAAAGYAQSGASTVANKFGRGSSPVPAKVQPEALPVPELPLVTQLDNHINSARQASLGIEQNRVSEVYKKISTSMTQGILNRVKVNGVKPLRNSLFGFSPSDQTVSVYESFSGAPEQSAVKRRLNFHADQVMAQDEKDQMNKKIGTEMVVASKKEEKKDLEDHLQDALNISRRIENNRVKDIKDNLVKSDKSLEVLLGKAKNIKFFRNTRVRLGLLDKDHKSVSFHEMVHSGNTADIDAVHRLFKRALQTPQAVKPVIVVPENIKKELPPEIKESHALSASAHDVAANKDSEIEQNRVVGDNKKNNWKWFDYLKKNSGDSGEAIDIFNAAIKAKFFRNTKAKMFGYDPKDQSVSFLEAFRGKRDDMAVKNRIQYQADIAAKKANQEFHKK
jgi:hypothetical protein